VANDRAIYFQTWVKTDEGCVTAIIWTTADSVWILENIKGVSTLDAYTQEQEGDQ